MVAQPSDTRLLSQPVRVYWAGWESDTFRLQEAGWQLAVEFEPYRQQYRLLLHNEQMKLTGITRSPVRFEGADAWNARLPPFVITAMASRFEVCTIHDDFTKFQQIDAKPVMVDAKIRSVEDFNIFNIPLKRGEEVFIESANMTVIEHLEAIKRLQADKQGEIRAKMLSERSESVSTVAPASDVIVSLVEYREKRDR